jgi:hypothetical protein
LRPEITHAVMSDRNFGAAGDAAARSALFS